MSGKNNNNNPSTNYYKPAVTPYKPPHQTNGFDCKSYIASLVENQPKYNALDVIMDSEQEF